MNKKLVYGGDYYPEQWLDSPEILEQDIEFLKAAKMNLVSLGVFSWSELEPREGEYHLDWLEKIIDRLYDNGIYVMLATPSGAKPRWIAKEYPEVLRVTERGERNLFGERHNHCYTSPVYREKVNAINTQLAQRFGKHSGVVMWHISNEYGGECYCGLCQQAFREWLKQKYKTINALNHAWWAKFWGHTYSSFEEVEAPSVLGEKSVHGLNLDWKRFVSEQTIDFMRQEIKALRDAGAMQPCTTNMMYDFQGINYGKMQEFVDVISWDTYPLWHKQEDIRVAYDNGMQHDYMRSLKQKPFLLMESCPTATNWQGVSKLKKPGMLMNASVQTIAHGGDSVQYFQIRQSRGSFEKFHGAVIDHYGKTDTRVFREISQVGEALEHLAEIAGTKVEATAALLYDVENRWAMEDAQGPRNKGLFYHQAAVKSYQAMKKYGLNVDVIDMDKALDSYRVVAAPMLYMFRGGIEEKLRKYVEGGGILIMTYWSGVVDENDLCHLGKTPHGLTDVLGLRREEIDGLYDWESNTAVAVPQNSLGITESYTCSHLCELVQTDGAEVLMEYGEDFYAGKPVLTAHSYGKGKAYYVCADMEEDFYTEVYRKIFLQTGIKGILPEIPENVEVCSRCSKDWEYIFIQNYGEKPVKIKLPEEAEILVGQCAEALAGRSSAVIKVNKSGGFYEVQH